jgi:hypothetical protein
LTARARFVLCAVLAAASAPSVQGQPGAHEECARRATALEERVKVLEAEAAAERALVLRALTATAEKLEAFLARADVHGRAPAGGAPPGSPAAGSWPYVFAAALAVVLVLAGVIFVPVRRRARARPAALPPQAPDLLAFVGFDPNRPDEKRGPPRIELEVPTLAPEAACSALLAWFGREPLVLREPAPYVTQADGGVRVRFFVSPLAETSTRHRLAAQARREALASDLSPEESGAHV